MEKVEVTWGDAAAGGGGWERTSEACGMELSICSSVCYLLKKDKKKMCGRTTMDLYS